MREIKLNQRAVIKLHLHILTGIHIGGTKDIYGIGGVDSPVIKDPVTSRPIIPGSSLKGKLRSLMELGNLVEDHDVLFEGNETGPTRGIFRDMMLSEESAQELEKHLGEKTYTEIKAENTIDKFSGKTKKGGLRFMERVPAGATFEGEIILNAYRDESVSTYIDVIKEGFRLLEHSYLGGSGTRGYGKVKVDILSEDVL